MKRWSIEAKVLGGFGFALTTLMLIGTFAYWSAMEFIDNSRSAARSHEIVAVLEEIFSLMNQAETGQRGYIITGDETNLQPRHAAVKRIGELLGVLERLTNDDAKRRKISELRHRVSARLELLDWVLSARRTSGFEAAQQRLIVGPGRQEMQTIQDIIRMIEEDERKVLQGSVESVSCDANTMRITFSMTLLASMVFLLLLFLRIRQEVDERRKAEERLALQAERLRVSEAHTRTIIDTAVDGIIVIDERGVVDRFNHAAEQMFEYREEEVIGKNIALLISINWHDGDDPCVASCLSQMREQGMIGVGREIMGMRSTGDIFPTDLTVSEMNFGGQSMFTVIVRDVSDRRRAEEQKAQLIQDLESANEELKSFAYVVSHDLKAPLRAIGTLADWISSDYADKFDEHGAEHMSLLIGRVHRMNRLIDGILEYSRVGRVRDVCVPVDLNRLINEVIDLLSPPDGVSISVENSLPILVVERTRIQQVFQNLLGNAIKYMDKEDGRIRVECVAEGVMWKFSVSDNGPGIEERNFERIFQLFQTLAPRDRVEGTGVGLTLVKKIIEMYGGYIWVESTIGQGSTFFFTMPQDLSDKTYYEVML